MKKVFTLVLVMAMAITSFAQVKSMKAPLKKDVKAQQAQVFRGFESLESNYVASSRSIMTAPEETELSFTAYDWQSNMGPRNFTAIWPDGFAVMCYTQATDDASFSDRGTGLAIWDPAVGEWEFTESRVENIKTGFGSIARYKENGLVVASHSSSECHLFFCENFRNGDRDFSNMVTLPNEWEPTWPVVQCSGEDLDIVHVLATQYSSSDPVSDAIRYYRYENGEFTADAELLEALDGDHMTDGGSNICYFMLCDPAKPNRVAFVLNNAWSDGKAVVSEDNGATWTERVFFQHPNINGDFTDDWFFYPRWTSAFFDENDNLNVAYEWNGSSGTAGSGSYYPSIGGVAFWSETLPKNELCVGGIGEVGQPFIMDSAYLQSDLYMSEWYWSNAIHDPVPEYIGELQIIDNTYQVWPWDSEELPDEYYWDGLLDSKDEHGSYNGGIAEMASMYIENNKVYVFWSMIAGDDSHLYNNGNHLFRLFCNMSLDGGLTWSGPKHLITDIMDMYDEMVYGQVIPYVYNDAEGAYLWYCYQNDMDPGTFVMGDEENPSNNFYRAVKVYIDYMDVEENTMAVAPMINVYPNPAQGSFNVTLNNESNVNIYNAVGQLVKTYNNVTELNVNLEAGVYFVNAGNQTVKVVVK